MIERQGRVEPFTRTVGRPTRRCLNATSARQLRQERVAIRSGRNGEHSGTGLSQYEGRSGGAAPDAGRSRILESFYGSLRKDEAAGRAAMLHSHIPRGLIDAARRPNLSLRITAYMASRLTIRPAAGDCCCEPGSGFKGVMRPTSQVRDVQKGSYQGNE